MKYFWLTLLFLLSIPLSAQQVDTSGIADLEISILTCGPGQEIYSLFGHTALRVRQPSQDIDRVYNWGMFDFAAPGYTLNFLRGKLDYWLGATTMEGFIREYHYYKRSVDEQVLNLNAHQKIELLAALNTNYKPENRGYKYDFFYDDCTTRIRDLLQDHLPTFSYSDIGQKEISFRGLLHTHLGDHPWTQFGMDILIGATTDLPAGIEEQMFLPLYYYNYIEDAHYPEEPLLDRQDKILDFPNVTPKSLLITPAVLFWIIFFIEIIGFFLFYISGDEGFLKWFDRIWFGLLSLVGIIFAVMWTCTDHEVCKQNYNLLWTVPWAICGFTEHKKIKTIIFLLTIFSSLIVLVGWNLLPQQIHLAIIPLALVSILKSLRLLGAVKWIDGFKTSIAVVGLMVLCLSAKGQERIAGITVVAPPLEFQSDPMKKIADVNANWIALVPYGITRKGASNIQWGFQNQWWGESPDGISVSTTLAENNGLKVMIKPQVWVPHGWVGEMDFDTEQEWKTWEASYREYLMFFVDLAIDQNIEMICIGTEFRIAAVKREAYWRQLIKDIRAKYKGILTYSANWDSYQKVPFWDVLDYIGISGYFPLSEMKTPPVILLNYKWKKQVKKLRKYSLKTGKMILFTEYGYLSVDGAAGKTWELESNVKSRTINEQAQANGYEALFKAFSKEDFWAGGFLWKWFPEGKGHEGYPERDYTPQGKKAEKILAKWHERITNANASNR